jgi:hypothetical protein
VEGRERMSCRAARRLEPRTVTSIGCVLKCLRHSVRVKARLERRFGARQEWLRIGYLGTSFRCRSLQSDKVAKASALIRHLGVMKQDE